MGGVSLLSQEGNFIAATEERSCLIGASLFSPKPLLFFSAKEDDGRFWEPSSFLPRKVSSVWKNAVAVAVRMSLVDDDNFARFKKTQEVIFWTACSAGRQEGRQRKDAQLWSCLRIGLLANVCQPGRSTKFDSTTVFVSHDRATGACSFGWSGGQLSWLKNR
jgi:hypothetical protein